MISWLLSGCSGCSTPAPELPALEDDVAPCAPLRPLPSPLAVGVHVHRGQGVTEAQADQAFGLLAGRASTWGVRLEGRRAAPIAASSLLGAHPATEAGELDALASWVEESLRPRRREVHLVVLADVIDPRSKLAGALALEGFGLHPTAGSSPEGAVILEEIGGDFTPFVLVDVDLLADPVRAREVLAHELGHAWGLEHVDADGNVMKEGVSGACAPVLDAAQLGRLSL